MNLRHCFVEARRCAGPLDDLDALAAGLRAAAAAVGATPVGAAEVRYVPHGVTAVLVLAESHLVLSTWPEHRLALVDVLLCNEGMDPAAVWAALATLLRPGDAEIRTFIRHIGP